jgi:hemerythrin
MLNGKVNEAVAPAINSLVAVARHHFTAEEKLMETAQFPGLADHCARHKELGLKVQEFLARHDHGDVAAYSQFMYFVRDWMTKHMENEDHAYAAWLAEHGIH